MYQLDDIKLALKAAGLPPFIRHAVYCNLPARAEPKDSPLYPGLLVFDKDGEEAGVVAACMAQKMNQDTGYVRLWKTIETYPGGIVSVERPLSDLYGGDGRPYTRVASKMGD